MKRLIILFLILLCFGVAFADTINQYSVPESSPLNQKITATGLFDSNAGKNEVLCSFYFLDSDDQLVYRATDQYTVASGRFTMIGTTLTEPLFVRGETYNLHTECGGATADADFTVGQKQEAFTIGAFSFYPQGTTMDFMWLRDNGLMVFFLFIMIFVVISVLVLAVQNLY